MKLRFAALIACGLGLAAAAQQQPALTPPATLKGPCPDIPENKTAWFDPSQYPLLGNGVKVGRVLYHPDPEYSESARKTKTMGNVLLAVAINIDGTVDAVKVVCKLEPGLDQNAADAVKQWKFPPPTKNGEPVPVRPEVAIGFRLY